VTESLDINSALPVVIRVVGGERAYHSAGCAKRRGGRIIRRRVTVVRRVTSGDQRVRYIWLIVLIRTGLIVHGLAILLTYKLRVALSVRALRGGVERAGVFVEAFGRLGGPRQDRVEQP